MKLVLAALMLGLASAPLHAQRGLEGKEAERPKPAPKVETKPPPRVHAPARPPAPPSATRPQDQRAKDGLPAPKQSMPDRMRPAEVHRQEKSPPSAAQQLQQQEFERQQLQRQHAAPQQQAGPEDRTAPRERRGARCSAYPVCVRQAGSYGSCQGVEAVYASEYIGRRDIAARCVQANTPDSCDCAAQCSRVAQCSIF